MTVRAVRAGRLRVTAFLAVVLALGAPGSESPVADAAERGDAEAVRSLLRGGADVNAAQGDGMTALHWAARRGDVDLARVLLYAGATPGATTRLGGATALHMAAREGHAAVMEVLLAGGAKVMGRTATGVTPLHLAAASGVEEAVRLLVDRGADVDAREGARGETPLMFAVAHGRRGAVGVLLELGADVSAATTVVDYVERAKVDGVQRRRRNEMLAMRLAAERGGDAPAARSEAGAAASTVADASAAQLQGRTEAPAPAGAERPDSLREGARKEVAGAAPPPPGADAHGKEPQAEKAVTEEQAADQGKEVGKAKEEPRPLSYADLVGRQGGMTALHLAARDGRTGIAMDLLDGGADVNRASGGDHSTPLLVATINGNYDLAMALLERGADPTLASDAGATPLFTTLNNRWAPKALFPQPTAFQQQETTYLQLMEALLEAGADPNVRLEKHLWYTSYNFDLLGVDFGGATPFWRAAYALDVEAMRLLVAHGADPAIPTRKPAERRRGPQPAEDLSGLPPVPVGGPGVYPIHAASGVGYGWARAGNSHRHVPGGWLPAVRYLVEELGADVNQRDYRGFNAVHHAAARGDNELILYLVEKGADVLAVGRSGQTTVDMANGPQQRVQPFPETIALLEDLGAKNNHNCRSCE